MGIALGGGSLIFAPGTVTDHSTAREHSKSTAQSHETTVATGSPAGGREVSGVPPAFAAMCATASPGIILREGVCMSATCARHKIQPPARQGPAGLSLQ